MFSLLRDLGGHVSRNDSSPVTQLAEPVGKDYHYGSAICFDNKGEYQGIRLVQGTAGVVYKSGPSAGFDFTLVSRQSRETENVVKRLLKNAEDFVKTGSITDTHRLIEACVTSVRENLDRVVADVDKCLPEDRGISKRVYLFWALVSGDQINGFYERPEVQEYLVRAVFKRYGSKSKKSLSATDRACSVCGEHADEVYGNFTDIACYNLDKTGFITGGFDYERAPANFPICAVCIGRVLTGKTFAEQHLSFRLAGLSYWILPEALDPEVYRVVVDSIKSSQSRETLGKALGRLTDDEQEIFGQVSRNAATGDGVDLASLNMIFYDSSQAAWRIVAEIREVLPSRIRLLFDAKIKTQSRREMALSRKEKEAGYSFTLATLRPFCGAVQKRSDRRYLAYLEAIFQGRSLDRDGVIRDLVGGIVASQKKDPNLAGFTVRDAWASYLFLSQIRAVPPGGTQMKEMTHETRYDTFMAENPGFFADICKQTAFLTGCYVGAVLYVQRQERGTQPFEQKFIGRRLNEKVLRRLFVDARTKLTHYKALGLVHALSPRVAESWVECADKWSITDEDTTFAFALGVTLQPTLAKENSGGETPAPEVKS